MISAFCASSLFLVGYVAYHYVHGDTKYAGQGALRYVYFGVLISHVLLSMAVVPMALASFYYAFRERFQTHARIARILLPIWLYVSVTGVLIYFMLRR
jgi:putative membrane protein